MTALLHVSLILFHKHENSQFFSSKSKYVITRRRICTIQAQLSNKQIKVLCNLFTRYLFILGMHISAYVFEKIINENKTTHLSNFFFFLFEENLYSIESEIIIK